MNIIFEIEELGPIRNSRFELSPFMIFSGESNTGKSYAGLLVYSFFRILEDEKLWEDFMVSLITDENIAHFSNGDKMVISTKKMELFINNHLPKTLQYLLGYENVNFKGRIIINSSVVLSFIKDKKDKSFIPSKFAKHIPTHIVKQIKLNKLSTSPIQFTSIFPTSRGGIATFSYNMKRGIASAGMYEDFLEDLDTLQAPTLQRISMDTVLENLLKETLIGDVKTEKGELFYQFNDYKIPLVAASSSVKELAPLFLLLKRFQPAEIALLFEEPETHLHPDLQRKVASILAYMAMQGAYIQVTTHSDYMLNQWNFLLMQYFISKQKDSKEELSLNPEIVGNYTFKRGENGDVYVEKQVLDKNHFLSFDSFSEVIDEMTEQRYSLLAKLENDGK